MLIRLGDAIVDLDEIVYVKAAGDNMHLEILFKSHGKVFNNGKTLIVHSKDPQADLDRLDPANARPWTLKNAVG